MLTYVVRVGLLLLWHAWCGKRATPGEPFRVSLRAWPWRCDAYRHVNNAIYLRMAENARWAWTAQTPLFRHSAKNRWSFLVGGTDIVYRRSIPLFSRFEIVSRVIGGDDKWFFFAHDFVLPNGRTAARALVRATVRSPSGVVPPTEVLKVIGENLPQLDPAAKAMGALADLQLAAIADNG